MKLKARDELEDVARMWEYSLMLRMLGPHQGIRLERLRAELDDDLRHRIRRSLPLNHNSTTKHKWLKQANASRAKSLPSIESHSPKSLPRATQMARDTNGIQTVKKPHGIEMKVPIQSGNVSKRETIEALTESARTGI